MATIHTPYSPDHTAHVDSVDHHGNVSVEVVPGVKVLLADREALDLGASLLGATWKSGHEPAEDSTEWEEDRVGAALVLFRDIVRAGLLPQMAAEWAEHRAPTDLPGDEVARIFGENL